MTMDAIDEMILAETPEQSGAVAVIDAPGLVEHALERSDDVRVWCDDWRDASLIDDALLVNHPKDLSGVGLVWAHLPKSLGALDEQAASVQGADDVTFLAGGRVKHMSLSMNEVLGKHFVAVSASLGRKKSRVLRAFGPNNLPSDWPKARHHDDLDLVVCAHGATFSGTKVDAGTKLLLSVVKVEGDTVLDFGSGSGVLGAYLNRRGHRVLARDVSWSAVAATLETAEANDLTVEATWGDGLAGYADASIDAIVTNPPFHKGTTKDSSDTLQMFDEAARVLTPGGQLWCVYNSHLPYRKELNVRLGRTRVVQQDRQYTVTLTTI